MPRQRLWPISLILECYLIINILTSKNWIQKEDKSSSLRSLVVMDFLFIKIFVKRSKVMSRISRRKLHWNRPITVEYHVCARSFLWKKSYQQVFHGNWSVSGPVIQRAQWYVQLTGRAVICCALEWKTSRMTRSGRGRWRYTRISCESSCRSQ